MATVPHRNLTAADLHEPKGIGDAAAGQVYIADGNGSGSWTDLLSLIPTVTGTVPIATVVAYAGSTPPAGWVLCAGQTLSRSIYSLLFNRISTTYGAGNGTTTFNAPDLRGRGVFGLDNMGGTSAGRITDGVSGISGTTLGASGGSQGVSLTLEQLAAHTHAAGSYTTGSAGAHTHSISNMSPGNWPTGTSGPRHWRQGGTYTTASAGAHTHSITGSSGTAGLGAAHQNMPPTVIMNYIIYTGVF